MMKRGIKKFKIMVCITQLEAMRGEVSRLHSVCMMRILLITSTRTTHAGSAEQVQRSRFKDRCIQDFDWPRYSGVAEPE